MKHKSATVSLILFCFLLFILCTTISVKAVKEQEKDSAGIGVVIFDDQIANIQIGKWTPINLTVVDTFGLNWDNLKESIYPEWWMKTVWRYQFGLPHIEQILGYTTIVLEPEVISSNGEKAEGWSVKIDPPTITGTTMGRVWDVTLYAQVNRLASDYNPIIKIKTVRNDVQGNFYNVSYSYIPVKSVPRNFATIEAIQTTKKSSPNSIVNFQIKVTNEGEYRDIFQFDVRGRDGMHGLISEQSLVLESGETRYVELTVLTPEVLFDSGTPREVNVSVYPIKNPNERYSISVVAVTEGFYMSPLSIVLIALLIIVIVIIVLIFINLKGDRKSVEKIKKEKPKSKKDESKSIFSNFFKNSKKKKLLEKKEPEKPEEKIEQKPEEPKIEEKIEPVVDKKAEAERRKKERAIIRIKREQEKQLRKF